MSIETSNVVACIDGTDISMAVCDMASWAALAMQAPLEILHVLDKSEYPTKPDYSGNLALGSRSTLLAMSFQALMKNAASWRSNKGA